MSWYRSQLEQWLKKLVVDADIVLDVGGKQNPAKGRTKSWNVKKYEILDLPEFDLHEDIYYIKADLIFCLEVFEYLYDPMTALGTIGTMLADNGKAYISAPLVYPVHNETDRDCLRYTENGFKRMCLLNELKCEVAEYRRDSSGYLTQLYKADGMKVAQGFDHSITGYIFEVSHA